MNDNHQHTLLDVQETEFGSSTESKQRRIYFTSGETLEEEDSEEDEQEQQQQPFDIHPQRYTFKRIALLIGRMSLLTCDFLGKKLAGVLGLDAAKYQYAIDQYQQNHKGTNDQATAASASDGKTQMSNLTAELERHRYGTFGRSSCETEPQKCCDEKQTHRNGGCNNSAYQPNEDGVN